MNAYIQGHNSRIIVRKIAFGPDTNIISIAVS